MVQRYKFIFTLFTNFSKNGSSLSLRYLKNENLMIIPNFCHIE